MGLTCSVLGHRYGEREHIEERDRQGSEAVIAIREVKTCERCGEQLVVSETKEVTAVATEQTEAAPREDDPEPETEPAVDDIEVAPDPAFEDEEAVPETVEGDDGVILPDEPEDREPGEWLPIEKEEDDESDPEEVPWPGVEDDTKDETADEGSTQWPDPEGEDEGFDAVDTDGDIGAQIIEAAPQTRSTSDVGDDEGFVRAEEIDSPANPDDDNVHTEFFCPHCDWSAKALTTSVRRGDICPECRRGYIAEREV